MLPVVAEFSTFKSVNAHVLYDSVDASECITSFSSVTAAFATVCLDVAVVFGDSDESECHLDPLECEPESRTIADRSNVPA